MQEDDMSSEEILVEPDAKVKFMVDPTQTSKKVLGNRNSAEEFVHRGLRASVGEGDANHDQGNSPSVGRGRRRLTFGYLFPQCS